jgi:hypothetical protein
VSIEAFTIWAAVVAAASVLLLVAVDHRKPARRRRVAPRAKALGGRLPNAREVEHLPTRPYRRTPLWRRILSFGGLGVLGVVIGALLAISLAALVIGLFLLLDGATR